MIAPYDWMTWLSVRKLIAMVAISDSSEEVLDKLLNDEVNGANGRERPQQQRSNTTVHVCWHRNTSISSRDHLLALEVNVR